MDWCNYNNNALRSSLFSHLLYKVSKILGKKIKMTLELSSKTTQFKKIYAHQIIKSKKMCFEK